MKHSAVFLTLLAVAWTGITVFPASAQPLFPDLGPDGEPHDRTCRVLHYRIEVSIDDSASSVTGSVAITLVPLQDRQTKVVFDAGPMDVASVTMQGHPLHYLKDETTLSLDLTRPSSWRDTLTAVITYSCRPKQGMYFVRLDTARNSHRRQVWTQGEDMDNHYWFPCHDFPDEKATSEVIATVREPYTLVSNGSLVATVRHPESHTTTYHWRQDQPHASYLIMLAAGKYSVVRDSCGRTPLEYYVYPGQEADARESFGESPAIMRFFNTRFGIPYPWRKYAQIEIADFMYGGMENTTATTLNDESVVMDARARIDQKATGLIAHEMSHQWWGDLLTCKDWRHLWLNESFASYCAPLYTESSRGKDEFDFQMYGNQRSGIAEDKASGRKPIVSVGSYVTNLYPRGASVLHMLRFVLGDSLFWRSLHSYGTTFRYQSVETRDFKNAIQEVTGRNLYWFFDEWLYKAGYPVFTVSSRWDDTLKVVHVAVRQDQVMDSLTGVFRMPVDVAVTDESGESVYRVELQSRDTVFALPSSTKPRMVIFDRGNWLLKEVNETKSRAAWEYQATHATLAIDRFAALEGLRRDQDTDSVVPFFAAVVERDRFPGVRSRAVTALGQALPHSDSMRALQTSVLLRAATDSDAGVRRAAVYQLQSFRGDSVTNVVRNALGDSSYLVAATALRSLAAVDSAAAVEVATQSLATASYHDIMGITALHVLASTDSLKGIQAAVAMTAGSHHQWRRISALQILNGFVSAHDTLRSLCVTLMADQNERVRGAAIRMLGMVGEPAEVMRLLEPIAGDTADHESGVAKEVLENLKKRGTPAE